MRILHLGGFSFTVEAQASAERRLGHEATCFPAFDTPAIMRERDWESLAQMADSCAADLYFWHILKAAPPKEVIEKFRVRAPQAFILYTESPSSLDFIQEKDAVFASASPKIALPNSRSISGWHIPPLLLSNIPRPEPYEPNWGEVRILYVPYQDSTEEINFILSTIEKIQTDGLRLLFALIRPEDISNLDFLEARLKECDIFLESLSLRYPGPLSYLAMAYGKTVMSGLSADARSSFEKFAKSPIIDVTQISFASVLSNILREPKSLRDLGKRSRQFAESYCNTVHIPCLKVE